MSAPLPKTIRCFCGVPIVDKAVLVATCGKKKCAAIARAIRAEAKRSTRQAMDRLYARAGATRGRTWPHLRGCRCFCCEAVRKALKTARPSRKVLR